VTCYLRTRSAIRTRTDASLSGVPLPLGYPGLEPAAGLEPASCRLRNGGTSSCASPAWRCCALSAIRTRTVDVLNVVPLPIGLQGREDRCGRRPRTSTVRVRAGCAAGLHQPAGRPAGDGPAGRRQRKDSAAQVGTVGTVRRGMRASDGVRSSLRWLQPPHAATVFSQELAPPRERGSTWSTVVAVRPQ
jgi:hypothetical protein